MRFRPLEDKILAKRLDMQKLKFKSIHLPEISEEKPLLLEVLEIGPGKLLPDGTRTQMHVQPGDICVIGTFRGVEVIIGEEDLTFITDTDILAVLEKEEDGRQAIA